MTRPDSITAALIALALFTVGIATGCVLTNIVGPEPTPAPAVTVTAPPRTVEVTRAPERASRGEQRRVTPSATASAVSDATPLGGAGGRETYQDYARNLVTTAEWPCLRTLWQRESGWDPTQRTGSHYGIAQRRGETNTDYRRQIQLGLSYIEHRYGDACDALAHSDRMGWY